MTAGAEIRETVGTAKTISKGKLWIENTEIIMLYIYVLFSGMV